MYYNYTAVAHMCQPL